jgi:hypothetical protein
VSPASFVIHERQLETLGSTLEAAFLGRMRQYTCDHFPAQTAILSSDRLDLFVNGVIEEGRKRGLRTARELCQYLGLTLSLDGQQPAWIEAAWRDRWISSPGARLDRIIEKLLHRNEIEKTNTGIRATFEEGVG